MENNANDLDDFGCDSNKILYLSQIAERHCKGEATAEELRETYDLLYGAHEIA